MVLEEVPPNCTAVGVPARVVKRDGVRIANSELDQIHVPDPVSEILCSHLMYIDRLTKEVDKLRAELDSIKNKEKE